MLLNFVRIELVVCWIAWILGFVDARKRAAGQVKALRAPGSAWGIILQGIGFGFESVQVHPVGFEKSTTSLIASMILAPLAVLLGRAGAWHLGKQWRFEAAISEDHELIQTGPYRLVRHPIYASMLLLFLAAGTALTWWPLFLAGLIVFLIGTEIRVRMEDRLLADRFGDQFFAYRGKVCAYIPPVR